MGKSSPKPPAAPDPRETAAAQASANKETAIAQALLNMTDVYTPFGSSTFTQIGGPAVPGFSYNPSYSGPTGTTSGATAGATGGTAGTPFSPYKTLDDVPTDVRRAVGALNFGASNNLDAINNIASGGFLSTPANMQDPFQYQAKMQAYNLAQGGGTAGGAGGAGGAFGMGGGAGGAGGPYGDIPRFAQNITLDPFEQAQLERERGIRQQFTEIGGNQLGQVANALSSPFNLNGLPEMVTRLNVNPRDIQFGVGANDFSSDRQKVEDALYQRQLRTLDPELARQEQALQTQLANQGINLGSEAYTDALDIFNRSRADQLDLARNSAILAGGGEQSRLFGMDLSKGQFANQAQAQDYGQQFGLESANAALQNAARQQAIQERVLERMQPIQEISSLLGQGGQVQLPQFGPAPQTAISPTNVAGITQNSYANQLNAYNNAQANQGNMFSSILGAGAKIAPLFF